MPVTELALLRLLPGIEVSSPALLANLSKAKDVMEGASGHKFQYYHCIEDPSLIFIIGAWASVTFHMQEFIPSRANQEILSLLKDQITVHWMFHLDIDQTATPLPLQGHALAIGRHFIDKGEKDVFQSRFEASRDELEGVIGGIGHVVGGYRMDKGFDPLLLSLPSREEGEREEFVLFTGWDSVEHHHRALSAETEGFEESCQIRNYLGGADIKHGSLLHVCVGEPARE
ncbi:hypothetical protein A1O3_02028 [Capronia epimyces CBS 606.96]|uniref:ABM domain-containing protein n=1 Tax=Capronia epimyces CBS 606.96 TaxID=1182542 RepID=W9Z390_9EURO|nr:uncharacterized protein A1O3_02028 [Capronia epimyces CBS 606.96]EXJ88964.1 hypothetical protein A1O3_02028 [Capronia epimyces CBS 606.96]